MQFQKKIYLLWSNPSGLSWKLIPVIKKIGMLKRHVVRNIRILLFLKLGMVEIYQHQSLWDNRQYPRIHRAFAQIWQTEKLWVSLDRANMKPPTRSQNPEWNNYGMIHWDVDTSQQAIPFGVQGVLYLTDTAENQGEFQCIPGFHHTFYDWVKSQPVDRNPRVPNLNGLDVKSIAGQAGDLLIWHRLLAHGNGHNTATQPRLAQYITMSPINTKLKKIHLCFNKGVQSVSKLGVSVDRPQGGQETLGLGTTIVKQLN